MTEEEKKNNAEKNLRRVQLMVGPDIFNRTIKEQQEKFKDYQIFRFDDGKRIKTPLDIFNFDKSMIFLCEEEDFSNLISYFGLLKMNHVVVPDTSYDGSNSFVYNNFMVIDSRDIVFSKIPQDSFYVKSRDGDIPESWNSINFAKKEICIWRLADVVGIGDNEKMYGGCYAWIDNRIKSGKLDWIFYKGKETEFKTTYRDLAKLNLPIYYIERKKTND